MAHRLSLNELREFVRSKLQTAYDDFRRRANAGENLCVCKTLHYKNGHLPDYGQALVQDFYLLRYLPAYMGQYHFLYNELLKMKSLPELRVVSVGCGAGVDFWGLLFALKECGLDPHLCLSWYRGFDPVVWRHWDPVGHPRAFRTKESAESIEELDRRTNVLVFPLTLSELTGSALLRFHATLRRSGLSARHVALIGAFRTEDFDAQRERLRFVGSALDEQGYALRSAPALDRARSTPYIADLLPGYKYPRGGATDEAVCYEGVCNLRAQCRAERHCEDECSLGRKPILKTDYFNLTCFIYERERRSR